MLEGTKLLGKNQRRFEADNVLSAVVLVVKFHNRIRELRE
jgi:hypothetical protein